MSPHVPPDVLSALVDGECAPEERRVAHEHLLDCHDCQRLFREYRETGLLVASLPRRSAPEDLVSAVLTPRRSAGAWLGRALRGPRRYAAAAVVSLVVLISAGGLARPVDPDPPPVDLYVSRHASVSVHNGLTGQVIFAVKGR